MSLVDKTPKPPRLDRFCFMFDLYLSVKYTSFLMVILWAIYALSSIISAVTGNSIWAMIWSAANIVTFIGVVFGLNKNKKMCVVPALFLCPIAVIIGCINVIVNFVTLSIFGAIWLAITTVITAYYWLALFSVYNDMSSPVTSPEEAYEVLSPMMSG